MKRLRISVSKALFVGALASGIVTAPAVADTVGTAPIYTGSSETMFLASVDFKGLHPNKPHVVYERQIKKGLSVRAGDRSAVVFGFSGKPPYNRHTVKQHALEKMQFARLEESVGVKKHEHDIYHGSRGSYPPYKRN